MTPTSLPSPLLALMPLVGDTFSWHGLRLPTHIHTPDKSSGPTTRTSPSHPRLLHSFSTASPASCTANPAPSPYPSIPSTTSCIISLDIRTHAELYWCIERVFDLALPMLERTMGRRLRGQDLQVVVKAANYVLMEGEILEGRWHCDECRHDVVATALYLAGKYDNPYVAFLEENAKALVMDWRTPGRVRFDESNPRAMRSRHESLDGKHRAFLRLFNLRTKYDTPPIDLNHLNIGTIPTPAGRIITFPNTLQHRIELILRLLSDNPAMEETHKVLCFSLVDPDRHIVSTSDVPEQRWEVVGPEVYAVLEAG
ncbi:hypothetical protein BDK51DRAFT_32408, partial [Blyttiomyces helicus]